MATKNTSGISIKIEAFLPTGSTIEEQYTALSMVRDAQTTGDYSAVLAASVIDSITSKNITRRVPVAEAEPAADTEQEMPLEQRRGKKAAA